MNIRVLSWASFVSRIRGWAYFNMDIFFEGSSPMRPKMGAEIFRDSMEDYEYLFLANNKQHPMAYEQEEADPVALDVGYSFTNWLRDHAKFAALRHELGLYVDGSRSTMAVLSKRKAVWEPVYINFQDTSGSPSEDPLIVDGNTYQKIGWDFFDSEKGYGWNGDGFDEDGIPTDRLRAEYVEDPESGDPLEKSYLYNAMGLENVFDYAVPNGMWTVTVAVGNPAKGFHDRQDVMVNNVVFNSGPNTLQRMSWLQTGT